MAKYRILVIALLLKNNEQAKFGEEVEANKFTRSVDDLVNEGYIELVADTAKSDQEASEQKDQEASEQKDQEAAISEEHEQAGFPTVPTDGDDMLIPNSNKTSPLDVVKNSIKKK